MNTYLGVSSLLGPDDVDEDLVAAGEVLYIEGYLYDRPEAKEAFRKAAGGRPRAGRKVSLTLSDSFCVDRHRDDFRRLVRRRGRHPVRQRGRADARCTRSTDFDDAVDAVRGDCELAASRGARTGRSS